MKSHARNMAISLVLASTAVGCSFEPPSAPGDPPEKVHMVMNASPILPLIESSRYVVMETPGKMTLMHGKGCADAKVAANEEFLGFRVQERMQLPRGYVGAVFLNGYRMDHQDGDRNLRGMSTQILNVEVNQDIGEMRWEAGGLLSDDSGNDPYRWCYFYGLVLWNPEAPELEIEAFHSDATPALTTFVHEYGGDSGNDSAVRDLPGLFEANDKEIEPRVMVPRGFGLTFTEWQDFNLFHVGFDLGMPEQVGHAIKWNAQTVLKDNATRRSYRGAALVSVLSGLSVHVWQPDKMFVRDAGLPNSPFEEVERKDFALTARSPAKGCIVDDRAYRKHEFIVDDVPFDHALPMLSGWNVGNHCGDSNVEHIGVWITEVEYEKQPGVPGKLKYTVASVFNDDGGWGGSDGNLSEYDVVVLGFNELDIKGK
jgi:hypothetical protein